MATPAEIDREIKRLTHKIVTDDFNADDSFQLNHLVKERGKRFARVKTRNRIAELMMQRVDLSEPDSFKKIERMLTR